MSDSISESESSSESESEAPVVRSVRLVREEINKVSGDGQDVFRLRITATDELLMPRFIFLHQLRLADPVTGIQQEDFVCMASPFDVTIYPMNEPDPSQSPPYYRKDTVDMLLPSSESVLLSWNAIFEEVSNLIATYNRLDVLQVVDSVVLDGSDTSPTDISLIV